jgi:hypothetical protein
MFNMSSKSIAKNKRSSNTPKIIREVNEKNKASWATNLAKGDSKFENKKAALLDYLKAFKGKSGLYFITKKNELVYIGIAKNLFIRCKQEMGWSNIDGATFVRKLTKEKGYCTENKYNKKIQHRVQFYILSNYKIECRAYKGHKTDYKADIKPTLLKEEGRMIKAYSPKYNVKKNLVN